MGRWGKTNLLYFDNFILYFEGDVFYHWKSRRQVCCSCEMYPIPEKIRGNRLDESIRARHAWNPCLYRQFEAAWNSCDNSSDTEAIQAFELPSCYASDILVVLPSPSSGFYSSMRPSPPGSTRVITLDNDYSGLERKPFSTIISFEVKWYLCSIRTVSWMSSWSLPAEMLTALSVQFQVIWMQKWHGKVLF